jgi:tetratricopeptide (TPR) repeat protein
VPVPITNDVDSKVMTQIKEIMEGDGRPYFQAALYYIENGKDLNQAVQWLDKAAAKQPDGFWIYYQKARALAKQGKNQEALVASNKSIELAKAAKNDDYIVLNEKLQKTL